MNSFELDNGFEVLPSDDEYLNMKSAYKLGKKHYPLPLVQVKWTEGEQEHFINGWLYQQWVASNEALENKNEV